MKRLLAILFCAAALGAAQTEATTAPAKAAEEQPKWLQKVFDLKYADPAVLADLLSYMVRAGYPDRIKAQPELHVISIGTYDPSFLQLAEEIVKRYDVPAQKPVAASLTPDIEVIAHILVASHKGVNGDAVPEDLSAVAKQLRSVFGYTDIKLLDSAVIRGRAGSRSELSGQFGDLIENYKQRDSLRISSCTLSP